MKKITKLLVTVIFCLGVAFAAVTPAFAAVAKVNNLKASVTATTVTLTWNKVSGASGYKVYQQVGKKWKVIALPKTNKQVVKKLTSGVTYKFCVRAFKGSGKKAQYGKLSDVVSARPVCIAPKTVTATPISPTAVKLSWSSLSSAKGYLIQKYDEKSKTWVKAAATTSTTVTLSGLKTNVSVKFRVRGYTQTKGKNVYGYAKAVTVTPDLKAPTGVKSALLSSTSAKLSWNAVNGAKGYAVQKYNTSTKKWTHVAFSDSTSYTASKLIPTVENRLRVVAYVVQDGKNVYGKASSYASVKPSIAKPTKLSHGVSDSTTVELSWNAVSGVTGYNVYAKSESDEKDALVATSTGAGCIVRNLKSDTEYTFTVRAYITASDSKSYSSAASNSTTWKTAPAPVTELTATRFSDSLIQLSWKGSPDAESISRYEVFVYVLKRNSAGIERYEWVSLGTYPTSKTSCDISKISYKDDNGETVSLAIEQKTDYQFKVQGYSIYRYHPEDNDNPEAIETEYLYSTAAAYTATTALSRVTNLKAENPTSSSLNVSWTNNTKAESYKLEMSKDKSTWTEVDLSKCTEVKTESVSTVCYTIGELEASTTYYFRITAIAGGVTSPLSDVAQAKTTPASITDLSFNNVKDTSLTLSWNPVEGAVKYEIFWINSAKENADWELLAETQETSFSKNELSQLTEYKFKVRAYTEGVSAPSAFSNEVSVTTALGKIQNLTFYSSTSNSVELRWTSNSKAASYKLESSKDQKTWEEYKPAEPITNQSGTSYVSVIFDKMTPSTEIYFRVTVINGEISSDYSNVAHAKTSPAPVEEVKAVPSDTSIALSWKKDSSVSNYIVKFRKKGTSDWTSSTDAVPALFGTISLDNKNAKATISGLSQFTDYEIQVSSYAAFESRRLTSTPTDASVKTLLSAVTGFEVVSATETSVSFKWNANSLATSYSLQVSPNGTSNWVDSKATPVVSADKKTVTATVNGFNASQAKYFRVFANNATTSSVSSSVICGMSAPTKVKDITATATSDTTVKLTWKCDSSASKYTVTGGGTAKISGTTAEISGLSAGTKYTFTITACNVNGTKEIKSEPVSKEVTTLLGKVQNVTVKNVSSNSITLSWNAVSGATEYVISGGVSATTNKTEATFTGLKAGTAYTIRIAAKNAATSGVVAEKTAKTAPGTFTVTATTAFDSVTLKISYTGSGSADGYEYKKSGDSTWTSLPSSMKIEKLSAGTKHDFEIRAYTLNNSGDKAYSATVSFSATTKLENANAKLSSVETNSVLLAWANIPGAKSYEITGNGIDKLTVEGGKTSATISGLDAGKEYTFTVTAIGENVSSAPSAVKAKTIPTSVNNFKATATTTSTDLTLSWDAIGVASKYEIFEGATKVGESATNRFVVKNGAQGSKHVYSIKAVVENEGVAAKTSDILGTVEATITVLPLTDATIERIDDTKAKITVQGIPNDAFISVYIDGKPASTSSVGNVYTITGLTAGAKKVKISVITANGVKSLEKEFTIPAAAPKAA